MEANPKRASASLSQSSSDINGGPVAPKIWTAESPRKRQRPRSSVLLSHDRVKDLRSHRVFSPTSDLSWDKLQFESSCADTEGEKIGRGQRWEVRGQRWEVRGEDRGLGAGIEASNGHCQNIDSNSKTKSLLPCVRGKVFKTPGSLSYKRLLPYLLNMSEANSCDRESDRCPNLEKGVNKGRALVECRNGSSNIVLDCSNEPIEGAKIKVMSSEIVESTHRAVVLNEFQNGDNQKSSSPNSTANHLESDLPVSADELLIVKDGVILKHSDDNKIKDTASTGVSDDGFCGKVQDIDIANTNRGKDAALVNFSEDTIQAVIVHHIESQKETEEKEQRRDDGDVINQVNQFNEQYNQRTPPDAEIYARSEVEENEADRPVFVLQDMDNLNGKLSNGVNHEIASLAYNARPDIHPKCRVISKPRSQMKLFRCPGSFSYRRMLPFLRDITKDNSDALISGQEREPGMDLEQPASLASDIREIPLDKSGVFQENQKDASAAQPSSVQAPTNDRTSNNENLISAVNGIEETEALMQVKEVESNTPTVVEISMGILTSVESIQNKNQPVLLLCSSDSESKSKDELAIPESNEVTYEAEGGLAQSTVGFNNVKSVADRLDDSLPQLDSPVSSRILSGGPKKGILKRNPRGCRGLCTCLNCASFRLHAERAFEFSRNQMEDTEELVLDLVNELSYLHQVLESTADLPSNVSQVKEACKKASEAEILAKDRLSHMNYDLSIHSRITCVERPRIKFANRVQEHLISKTNDEVFSSEA